MKRIAGLLLLTVVALGSVSARAEEKKDLTPAQKQLDVETKKLMDGLDKNSLRQFAAIRNAHGTIRAVENVQGSLGRAAEACADKHPNELPNAKNDFEEWRLRLRPTMKEAEDRLEKMVLLQGYAKPSEVRTYLRLFDEAATERDKKIKAVPVTELDECKDMLENMKDKGRELDKLIRENLGLDVPLKQKV